MPILLAVLIVGFTLAKEAILKRRAERYAQEHVRVLPSGKVIRL